MGNYSGSANTICPFYEREAKTSITCQGIIDNTYVTNKFIDEVTKNEWQKTVCETYQYGKCPIADNNNKKYDYIGQPIVKIAKPESKEIKKDTQLPGQMSFSDFIKRG